MQLWSDLWNTLKVFAEYLITFAAAGGLVIWALRTFFSSWLDSKFKERLQSLKAEQDRETEKLKGAINQEIEQVKGRINAQVDRKLRLHQYEFETLPRLWELIDSAFTAVAQDVMKYNFHSDLNGESDEALTDFANSRNYNQADLKHLLSSLDKNKAAQQVQNAQLSNASRNTIWELRRYNFQNKIFWPAELSEDVGNLLNEMTEASTLANHPFADNDVELLRRRTKVGTIFMANDRPRLRSIERTIKDRLNLDVAASAGVAQGRAAAEVIIAE